MTDSDGNIKAAKSRFSDAIRALIDPQPFRLPRDNGHGEILMLDSLYTQLRDSTGGQNVSEKGDSRQGRAPVWFDAVDLLKSIDVTVAVWHPEMPSTALVDRRLRPDTVCRLEALDAATYRPQDTDKVTRWSNTAWSWVGHIKGLLDPQSVKHISAPCPACGRSTVYKRDSSGQVVRQPALQLVTAQGCTCLACKSYWSPDRYLFLCRLLGFDLPEGVLE